MNQKPSSPFAGLDTALLRETQARAEHGAKQRARRPAQSDGDSGSDEASLEAPVAAVRQALKSVGKEIFYVRVTPAEKRRVDEATHAFKQRGIRTSANEVGRIALNHLLADWEANGERSMLARVLADRTE